MKNLLSIVLLVSLPFLGRTEDLRQTIRKEAQACANALVSGDFVAYFDYVHPRTISKAGGKDKMVVTMQRLSANSKAKGLELIEFKVGIPEEPKMIGPFLTSKIPQHLVMKTPLGPVTRDSYLLGISQDDGKHWAFTDLASVTRPESDFPELAVAFATSGLTRPDLDKGETPTPDRGSAAPSILIPFRKVFHVPLVQIEAAGRMWNFIVDTGAGWSAGSPEFALATVGATNSKANDRREVIEGSGEVINLSVVKLSLLRLGGKAFVNVPLVVTDFSRFTSVDGVQIDGLLGFQLFRNWRLTLDYAAGQMRLDPTNAPLVSVGTEVPYALREETPYVTLTLQGRPLDFILDTGNGGSLDFPAEQLGLQFVSPPWSGGLTATLAGNRTNRLARLAGTLELGGTEFIEPTVTGMPDNRFYVGGEILEHFTVTFDPLRQRVGFISNLPGPVRLPTRSETDVRFDRAKEPWTVLYVAAANSKLSGQIQLGDQCVRLNGEPVSAWPIERYQAFLQQTNMLHCRFARDGREFDVEVPIYMPVP